MRLILLCILSFCLFQARVAAQYHNAGKDTPSLKAKDSLDLPSLSGWEKVEQKIDRATSSKLYQMTYIAVPLITAGFIVKGENDHFHSLRNDYIPSFRYHYDDYLQYLPGVTMIGMKAAGVKGRSSWGRMLTSDVFSIAVMATTVNILKSSFKEMRPDGSGRNSFPSGHTATAFATATMMHKEYGLTRSPWYSVGAYSVATATAISRQLNNKHWMSDVLAGAGIGILSTELGYYFADLIFKDKGLVAPYMDIPDYHKLSKPSFAGLYVGFNLVPGRVYITPDLHLKTGTGSTTGFEGAWFMNPYIGFGGRMTISGNPVSFEKGRFSEYHPELAEKITSIESGSINIYSVASGVYLSYPITERWKLGTKALAGYLHQRGTTLRAITGTSGEGTPIKLDIIKLDDSSNLLLGSGVSLMYVIRPGLCARFFCDYNLTPNRFAYSSLEIPSADHHQTTHAFTPGASINILFNK